MKWISQACINNHLNHRHMRSLLIFWTLLSFPMAAIIAGPPPELAIDERPNATDALGDPLPRGALRRFGTTRLSHNEHASCVAYSPDGMWLASGGYDWTVRLWDARSGLEAKRFTVRYWVRDVVWSPTSDRVYACSDGDGIRCWDVATGKVVQHFAEQARMSTVHLAVSADGKLLASGDYDFRSDDGSKHRLSLWNLETGKHVYRVKVPRISSMAFSADAKLLAIGGNDTVRLLNVATGQEEPELRGDPQGIYGVAFSPDGKYLAAGGLHGKPEVCVWELPAQRLVHRLSGHLWGIGVVAFSPDSSRLLSAGRSFPRENDDLARHRWLQFQLDWSR